MPELLQLDAMALTLLGHDIAMLDEADLRRPTPCTGWTVTDLIQHMNERHEAVVAPLLPPVAPADDPCDSFAVTGARWVAAMEQTGDVVELPQQGPIAKDLVLSIHFVDMLVHRWDLSRALGRTCWVPDRFTTPALPIAQRITAPGSPLNGPDGVYRPALATNEALPAIDNIAALLGRAPGWPAE
ncbi:maleylpyruvate isomerase family mycothiol-dependent enzyme [Nocardia sp. CA-084685]|uniref:maleylpyruvate isomerase family mycothiol-dependent enzyme n=1 Tax=Nocardia sp. CA-084685 TaxID=3239970 RepID=UPI003D990B5A